MHARIGSLGDQGEHPVAQFAGFFQTEFGIGTERNAGALAGPGKSAVPTLGARRAHEQGQPFHIETSGTRRETRALPLASARSRLPTWTAQEVSALVTHG